LPTSEQRSALLALPWLAWARRFDGGDLLLRGRLVAPVEIGAGVVEPGPVQLTVGFVGGADPAMERADVVSPSFMAPLKAAEVEALLTGMWDLEIRAKAYASDNLDLRFGSAIGVHIPARAWMTASGSAAGPPHALLLSGPLQLAAGEAQLQLLGGRRLRWLSSLASVRLGRAVLHPDGRVALEGGARRGLDRAVRRGLGHAAEQLSQLVRYSPRFRRVRTFLPAW
jgi:hypothetical protein